MPAGPTSDLKRACEEINPLLDWAEAGEEGGSFVAAGLFIEKPGPGPFASAAFSGDYCGECGLATRGILAHRAICEEWEEGPCAMIQIRQTSTGVTAAIVVNQGTIKGAMHDPQETVAKGTGRTPEEAVDRMFSNVLDSVAALEQWRGFLAVYAKRKEAGTLNPFER